jgi:phage-related protein
LGHELRRPDAENLGDGLYELRVRFFQVNYRMLYFFHGRDAAVVSHGLSKERTIPPGDIRLALGRKRKFEQDPERHTFSPEG